MTDAHPQANGHMPDAESARRVNPDLDDTAGYRMATEGEVPLTRYSGEANARPGWPGVIRPAGWFLSAAGEAAPPVRHDMEPARADADSHPAASPSRMASPAIRAGHPAASGYAGRLRAGRLRAGRRLRALAATTAGTTGTRTRSQRRFTRVRSRIRGSGGHRGRRPTPGDPRTGRSRVRSRCRRCRWSGRRPRCADGREAPGSSFRRVRCPGSTTRPTGPVGNCRTECGRTRVSAGRPRWPTRSQRQAGVSTRGSTRAAVLPRSPGRPTAAAR